MIGPFGQPGRPSARWRRFFLGIFVLFLAVPVSVIVMGRASALPSALALLAIAIAVKATLLPRPVPPSGYTQPWMPVAVVSITGIAAYLTAATGLGSWITLFYFGAIIASRIQPDERAFVLLAFTGVSAAVSLTLGGTEAGSGAIQGLSVPLVGLAVFGITRLQRRNIQLLAARDEIARLAVAEERARIARDLHDTLGHDLSVIALKSELAGRLVASSPDRAVAEIGDVQRVAREALASVRETVGGYRRPTLDAELAEVRASLAAAGIDVALSRDSAILPPPVESVLAWAVREGSTNILRHSGTSRASIRIAANGGAATADIEDDGPPREAATTSDGSGGGGGLGGPGHGLAGLRERVAAIGGRLDAGPTGAGGYRLHVDVPLGAVAVS